MVAKAGSHLLAAAAFAMLAGAGLGADSARAQAPTCLAAPNGAAPAGTHWYYKTDQTTHQKCWYTRPQDQAATAAPAQAQVAPARIAPSQAASSRLLPSPPATERGDAANPDSDTALAPEQSAAPIALAPAVAPRVPARAVPTAPAAPRHIAARIARIPLPAADPRGERRQPIAMAAAAAPAPAPVQAAPDNIRWPDPPALPQTAVVAGSPFPPPPPNVSSTGDPSASSPATQMPSTDGPSPTGTASPSATAPAATAETPDADAAPGKADTEKSSPAKPPGRISVLLVLGGLILLLAAGMLLRGLVEHALSRRRVIKLARQEPRLMEPAAVPPPMPTLVRQAPSVVPGHGQAAQRASEVEAELRRFAESLRQGRPAANGTANGALGRNGAALRS